MEPGVSNWEWISWSNGVRKCCKERIQVNEDSVWSGGFSNRVNPDAEGRYLEKIRECLFEGNVQEAEKLAEVLKR